MGSNSRMVRLASLAGFLLGVAILLPVQPARAAQPVAAATNAPGGHFTVVRTLTQEGAARVAAVTPQYATQAAMTYQGGAVLHSPSVYLWFWGSEWNTGGYAGSYNAIVGFYAAAGGSAWAGIMQQYCSGAAAGSSSCPGGAGYIGNPSPIYSSGHAFVDTAVAVPSAPSQADIETAVTRAAAHFGSPTDAIYMVYTPSGKSEPGFTNHQYCAFHSAVTIGNSFVPYAYIPYLPDAGRSCGAGVVRDGYDGWSIIGGHEYAEAVTDPFPGPGLYGWIDTTPALNGQGEIGDKCSWSLASPALVTMSGSQWPVQPLFSNRALAAGVDPCVLGAAAACNLSALNPNLASPRAPNTPVVFTGVATCASGTTPAYQFWARTPAGTWTMVQDFGAGSAYSWPGGPTLGRWTFQVRVRGSTETVPYDNYINLDYDLAAAPCGVPTLVPSIASPAAIGTSVQLVAATSGCGAPPPLYQFWVRTPDSTWHMVRDYTIANTYNWNSLNTVTGVYTLEVAVKNTGSIGGNDALLDISYSLINWPASYDVSSVPTSWVMGRAQTFNIVVTNTGNQAWPSTGPDPVDLDLHFASYPGGSAAQRYWLSSLAFSLPADVAPGGSATVSVTMSPPGYGHLVLEAELIKEHQFWFSQFAPVNVSIAAPVWSASYNLGSVPTGWVMGQSQTFSVVVTNTGNQAWTSAGADPVELDFHFASYAGGSGAQRYWLSSQAFSLPSDVAPGQTVTVTMTWSPPGYGHLVLEAEMIKEHQFWFAQYAPVNVSISPS